MSFADDVVADLAAPEFEGKELLDDEREALLRTLAKYPGYHGMDQSSYANGAAQALLQLRDVTAERQRRNVVVPHGCAGCGQQYVDSCGLCIGCGCTCDEDDDVHRIPMRKVTEAEERADAESGCLVYHVTGRRNFRESWGLKDLPAPTRRQVRRKT